MEVFIVYEIGDYVIKPSDGVCRIENVLHLDMSGVDKNKLYYLLIPVGEKNKKLYIPVDTAEQSTRKTMTEDEAWRLIEKIPAIEEIWIDNEKLREQRYKEAIRSYDPAALIGIIKATYLRNQKRLEQGKKNTLIDERYFKMAEHNLYAELAFAMNKDESEICQIITDNIHMKV